MIYFLIFFISFFTKIYQIKSIPPSLFSDEVDIGYQANIYNKCFTDYFGNSFPTHFHSFSDWRTSGYIYSTIILQKLGFESDLSIRLPATIFGSLCVVILILMLSQATRLSEAKKLLLGIVLCINPWLFHFSRTGFEVTGMLFFILLGTYFLLKTYNNYQNKTFISGLIMLVLSTYFYSTAKIFSPILALFFIFFIVKKHKINLKKLFVPLLFVLIFCIPQIKDIAQQKSGYRFSYISVFSDPFISKKIDFQRYLDTFPNIDKKVGYQTTLFQKIMHNKITNVFQSINNNYLNSFSSTFLVINGDQNLRQGFGEFGMLLPIELAIAILGIYFSLKQKVSFTSKIFLLWLLLAPIPSSLTRDSVGPHATRLILMLPPILYFLGQGIISLLRHKNLLYLILILLFINATYFYETYFIHYPSLSSESWHIGMKEAVFFSNQLQKENSSIVNYYSGQIEPFLPFFMYYTNYSPVSNSCAPAKTIVYAKVQNQEYQKAESNNYFGKFDWGSLIKQDQNLTSHFILRHSELNDLNVGIQNYNNNYQPLKKLRSKILWRFNSPYYEANYPLVAGLEEVPIIP